MPNLKLTIFVITASLIMSCGGSDRQIRIDGFIQFAQQNGFSFKEVDYGNSSPSYVTFIVTPGRMDISFEVLQDARTARQKLKEYNTDVKMLKKVVAQDNTHASEMGWNPEAFVNENVLLYVPLNYVVFYDEATALIELFKRY